MKRNALMLGLLCLGLGLGSAARAGDAPERAPADQRGEISGPVGQGLYTKPFWRKMGRGTYLGGYMDFEYRNRKDSKQKFEALRMVPFIYADIAPGIRFATESECERGGATADGTGDSKLEFAALDYDLLGEGLGFRGGLVLMPLGKFNLIHDSPINDLNDRPTVSRTVIPSTFYEPAAGLFGTAYPADPLKLDYQFYVSQGFNGGANGSGKIRSSDGLRKARSNVNGSGDNNDRLAFSGRLGLSPVLGTDVGFSFHTGEWDDAGHDRLTILALDWGFKWRNLEFLGEYANAAIGRGPSTHASVPGRMDGYYVQANAHFLNDAVRQGSVFTGVVRVDHVDMDLSNRTSAQTANGQERVTFGLNFRPLEQTAFKLDYQLNMEDWARSRVSNDAWVLGLATYF